MTTPAPVSIGVEGGVDEALFERDELDGRVFRVGVAVLEGDHASVGEGAVGECLDRRDGRTGGELFAPAAQHGPAIERRGLFGEAVRTQQHVGRGVFVGGGDRGRFGLTDRGDGFGGVTGFEGLVVPPVT